MMDVDWSYLWDRNKPNFEDQFKSWLYGEYDEQKYKEFKALYAIGPIRDYMDYLLDLRDDSKYLDRYGFTYKDIYDPRKLKSTDSSARLYGRSYNMISRNIDKLYRN